MNKPSLDLEAQLAGVLEQDGVTMASPQGVRRRAERTKRKRTSARSTPSIFFENDEPPAMDDGIQDLDLAAVSLLVQSKDAASERAVAITNQERPRSAYVLSLRGLPLSMHERPADERLSSHELYASLAFPSTSPKNPDIYGMLAQDLAYEGYDPHSLAEQFTPNDFFRAYASVYRSPDRVGSALRNLTADVASFFQRVERVERNLVEEVHDTLTIVEVPRFSPARALVGFMALLLVVTLPANAVVLYRSASETRTAAEGAGNSALHELMAVKDSASLPESVESLKRASSQFREADSILSESSALAIGLASVVPNRYRSARALLEVGDKSSEAGRLLALAFEKMFSDPSRRLDERLDLLATYARGTLPLLTDATKAAGSVDPKTLPEDKREQFLNLAARLDQATVSVREFAALADFMSLLTGKDRSRTYLLVFQNHTELRPTGGFMGSIAEVTLDRGAVSKLHVPPGGTYDLKGQLLAHVIAPKPLHLINAHWQFQDANWFPDFPTTAAKLRWFWSKSGQPTLDGVVALNASLVEKVFLITGPIDMPEYGKTIDHTNFMLETQKAVELEYDREANTPKKFVGDLGDALMARMKDLPKDDWLKVAALISEGLQTKEIQVALSHPEEEALAERYGWSGQLKETYGDSLALIEANIAGQKTDGVIDETVEHVAEIQDDGSIVNRVTVTRTHGGTKGELFRGVRNVSYVRLYVPEGSELLDANGFDAPPSELFKTPDDDYVPDVDLALIETAERPGQNGVVVSVEGDRTVFGGWAQLDPGDSHTLTYRYRLPFTVQDIHARLEAGPDRGEQTEERGAYTLLLTSQSGKSTRRITSSVETPQAWNISWSRGATSASDRSATLGETWDRDRVLAVLLTSYEDDQKE